MSIDEIIRAWKSEEEALEPQMPDSPVGRELTEQELLDVGGAGCAEFHTAKCIETCWPTLTF